MCVLWCATRVECCCCLSHISFWFFSVERASLPRPTIVVIIVAVVYNVLLAHVDTKKKKKGRGQPANSGQELLLHLSSLPCVVCVAFLLHHFSPLLSFKFKFEFEKENAMKEKHHFSTKKRERSPIIIIIIIIIELTLSATILCYPHMRAHTHRPATNAMGLTGHWWNSSRNPKKEWMRQRAHTHTRIQRERGKQKKKR